MIENMKKAANDMSDTANDMLEMFGEMIEMFGEMVNMFGEMVEMFGNGSTTIVVFAAIATVIAFTLIAIKNVVTGYINTKIS